MFQAYQCPICHENRTHFTVIYKLTQEVRLDPKTGSPLFEAQEMESLLRPDGRPDIDFRCMRCHYTAPDTAFGRARKAK